MEARFNVVKEERKALVRAVSEVTGHESVYQGAPGFAFAVGNYIIDRYGTISCDGRTGAEDMRFLLMGLAERGFVFEGDIDGIAPVAAEDTEAEPDGLTDREVIPDGGDDGIAPVVSEQDGTAQDGLAFCGGIPDGDGGEESGLNCNSESGGDKNEPGGGTESGEATVSEADGDSGKLAINMPLFGFTESTHNNIVNLVAAKAWILKKMAETDALAIERDERHLRFPWFKPDATAVEVDAYSRLIAGMCETAKTKKRVTSAERRLEEGDNEKFKARCFLLSIGFIGEQYKQARKVLLAPFSGNGSHKAGSGKKAAPEGAAAAQNGGESAEAISVREDGSGADNADTGAPAPLICGECLHHCYYTDGEMRKSTGDIVGTSKRAPENYTHYCLGAPSGYRRIKHAADWSGCENAPKWCPLSIGGKAAATAGSGEENAEAVSIREDGSGTDSAPTGAVNGEYRDCLACGHSMSEPAETDGEFDRLFCAVKQDYVSEESSCDEFN